MDPRDWAVALVACLILAIVLVPLCFAALLFLLDLIGRS
jgi:hypothetical protein